MSIYKSIEELLSLHFNEKIDINSHSYVSGGSINKALKLDTKKGVFFVKANSKTSFPEMFKKEVQGLNYLRKTDTFQIPEVITYGDIGDNSFLVLDYLESGSMSSNFWDSFAYKLSKLHRNTSDYFGLDHDNYIGSLTQINDTRDSWKEFFIDNRLDVQLKLARDSAFFDRSVVKSFERFYNRIDEIFPIESASLLHGDLWSGNFMVGEDGIPVLIDPAVYFGHREMDLAMSQLFGGFDDELYTAYNKYYPLELGWQKRMNYCNLYPLLVHVNLFGQSYVNSVKSIVSNF